MECSSLNSCISNEIFDAVISLRITPESFIQCYNNYLNHSNLLEKINEISKKSIFDPSNFNREINQIVELGCETVEFSEHIFQEFEKELQLTLNSELPSVFQSVTKNSIIEQRNFLIQTVQKSYRNFIGSNLEIQEIFYNVCLEKTQAAADYRKENNPKILETMNIIGQSLTSKSQSQSQSHIKLRQLISQKAKQSLLEKSRYFNKMQTREASKLLANFIEKITKKIAQTQAQKIADQNLEDFLQELELENKKTSTASSKKKKKPLHKSQTSNVKSTQSVETAEKPLPKSHIQNKKTIDLLALQQTQSHFHYHPRVKRWGQKDPCLIRQFEDKRQNRPVYLYQDYDDKEISLQRAKHHLPGLDKLLTLPSVCDKYSFSTDKGVGLVTRLMFYESDNESYADEQHKIGITYVGIDHQTIFHVYYEEIDLENFDFEKHDIFSDCSLHQDVNLKDKSNGKDSKWNLVSQSTFDIDENDVLKIEYKEENYCLYIYPLRKNPNRIE